MVEIAAGETDEPMDEISESIASWSSGVITKSEAKFDTTDRED